MQSNYLPLENTSLDKLGFESKAREIATFINQYPALLPCSIAINGPWGSGKSTMLNFIEDYLHTERCSIIRFNPWMVTDRESLINNLFEEIYFEIDGGFTKTKQKFAQYAQKIVPSAVKVLSYFGATSHGVDPRAATIIGNSAGEATKNVGDLLFDKPLSRRKKELYKEMELMAGENEGKIVVMIDELDRLFPDEIITVFQMIKSSLDFPGLFFVVAMDETVVKEAIEKKGISRPDYYLQKIFQRNYYINTKHQIRTLVDNFLLNNLDYSKECNKALLECVQAFIFNDTTKYIEPTLDGNPIDYDNSLDGYVWDMVNRNSEKISKAYWNIFGGIYRELNLHNPRTFINFSNQILELWPKYYDYIITETGNSRLYIHSAFIVLITHLTNPTYTEDIYFLNNYVLDKETVLPPFVKKARDFFSVIIPEAKLQISNNQYRTGKVDKAVKSSVFYLNQFPDYLRNSRLKSQTDKTTP